MNQLNGLFSLLCSGKTVAAGAALCTLASLAVPAQAQERRRDNSSSKTHIAVDFDFNTAVDTPGVKGGGGGALRLGQEFDLFLVSLTPELGGRYNSFGGDERSKLYAGFLGGRLAIGKIIEPSVFAHVGVARLSGPESRTAPLIDGGLALDLTLLPLIDVGVHGAYNVMMPRDDGSAFKFVTLGLQAALVL
jgi:hypothetical protein